MVIIKKKGKISLADNKEVCVCPLLCISSVTFQYFYHDTRYDVQWICNYNAATQSATTFFI